ncbi:DEAD/DEAH box helicase [Escherichia coli]|uniref:DEAD/DEAH box helicase n=1 Tax=Escherichia coli TaxID=562 RepID=UPI00227BCD8D|nr:DEAD/DEAH box helicase [Escherichia coli]MCY6501477.1 DEAD/DEAH box helicase [Escherichia coli]
MKYGLPVNCGVDEDVSSPLFYKEKDEFCLTDVQYESLDRGVGKGKSVLVVSPTSTGKTLVGTIALTQGIQEGKNAVFLVTHRALARQKFEDFKKQLLKDFLDNDPSALVLATGDIIEDAFGNTVPSPLNAKLLVATYEKYLGILSASGVPKSMKSTVFVCDEIQLIGDENRGQQVEILLTLIKRAGWAQLVGLSAVLEHRDALKLSQWLEIELIYTSTREKHLTYECHAHNGEVYSCSTKSPEEITSIKSKQLTSSIAKTIKNYLEKNKELTPIIVFCMTKKETYALAQSLVSEYKSPLNDQMDFDFDGVPETLANNMLKEFVQYRVACHSADLIDEEREIIERKILDKEIDVVFATSTLAAGVNFPLGTAFFASWQRWNTDLRKNIPISSSEFHNMAGRVGRMGSDHSEGNIIYFSNNNTDLTSALKYLKFSDMPPLKSRIEPKGFNRLILQLVATGLSNNIIDLKDIVFNTLSGIVEQDTNLKSFNTWDGCLETSLDMLTAEGLLIKTAAGDLHATSFGKAVSLAGFNPESGVNLLKYFAKYSNWFSQCIFDIESNGNYKKLIISIFYACFSCPEFISYQGKRPTRYLPYMFTRAVLLDPSRLDIPLYENIWQANLPSINAAKLAFEWIEGEQLRKLEDTFEALTAGMLNDLYRNLAWLLKGVSTIVMACADTRIASELRPSFLNDEVVNDLRLLPRFINRLAFRVNTGLTDKALWLTTLNKIYPERGFKLTRIEMLNISSSEYYKPEYLSQGEQEAEEFRLELFKNIKPTPHKKSNWLRDAAKVWKINQRSHAAERHVLKSKKIGFEKQFKRYYDARGIEYEQAFEELLSLAGINYIKFDDGKRTGAPDYLVSFTNSPDIVVELKTKLGDNLVDFNGATDVLRASELYGYGDNFCVTLCHPGVDPSVLPIIEKCGRLSIVEGHDLGEALLRLLSGNLTQEQLWQWLSIPGAASAEDLPMKEYSFS